MLRMVRGYVTVGELRSKLLFTLAVLALFRLGSFLAAPGVDSDVLEAQASNLASSNILNLLALFSGGAGATISLFTLGLGPYIAASIIVQMGGRLYAPWRELQKEPGGADKLTQYTRYLTVAIAIAQASAMVVYFRRADILPSLSVRDGALLVFSLTVGSVLLMWMGEQITQRGIGNGISLLIFAGIVASLPTAVEAWRGIDPVQQVLVVLLVLAVVAGVTFVYEGIRRVPVQYARQVSDTARSVAGARTYIPIRVIMAGVMPAIFASSLLFLPSIIYELTGYGQWFADNLVQGSLWLVGLESILIIFFTYFYTAIIFDPVEQADNLRKHGGYIPGVRPGRPTAVFLDRVVSRLTLPGAVFLAALAALPSLVFRYLPEANTIFFTFGGTSLLIVVGVALQTIKQAEAQWMVHSYEGMISDRRTERDR